MQGDFATIGGEHERMWYGLQSLALHVDDVCRQIVSKLGTLACEAQAVLHTTSLKPSKLVARMQDAKAKQMQDCATTEHM